MPAPTRTEAQQRADEIRVFREAGVAGVSQRGRQGHLHDSLRTVIVAPMTTGAHAAPFRIPVAFGGKKGLILLDQIRTLDKIRLARKLGAVTAATLSTTLKTLQEAFAE